MGHLLSKRLSLYTPASFTLLLDTFVMDISLIEVSEFYVALPPVFLSRL